MSKSNLPLRRWRKIPKIRENMKKKLQIFSSLLFQLLKSFSMVVFFFILFVMEFLCLSFFSVSFHFRTFFIRCLFAQFFFLHSFSCQIDGMETVSYSHLSLWQSFHETNSTSKSCWNCIRWQHQQQEVQLRYKSNKRTFQKRNCEFALLFWFRFVRFFSLDYCCSSYIMRFDSIRFVSIRLDAKMSSNSNT